MTMLEVKVLSGRYQYSGQTYLKGSTFQIPENKSEWGPGITGSIARGNLHILGTAEQVENSKKEAAKVQVDLGGVPSNPIDNLYPAPNTNVTYEDGEEDTLPTAGDPVADALNSAVKESVAAASAKPKTTRQKK